MDELRSAPDEPGDAGRPERGAPEAGAGEAALRQRIEPRSRTGYAADLEQRTVSGWAQDRMNAPAEVLRRFEPRRAGLPEVSAGEAAAYLDAHRAERPWLAAARGCPPEVQRIFAALDQGGGHAHIRHEGWVTEEMNQRRVAYLATRSSCVACGVTFTARSRSPVPELTVRRADLAGIDAPGHAGVSPVPSAP